MVSCRGIPTLIAYREIKHAPHQSNAAVEMLPFVSMESAHISSPFCEKTLG